VKVSGERVSTPEGGFNPTWQRHVAAYVAADGLLPPGSPVLDLGCGVGHSFQRLAPRTTVGLDLDAGALAGQARETVVGDMRKLPFADGAFASVLSVQSIEHVPDPERVLAEVTRVLEPGGTAVFVTPNRLTFARPDEIIDPFHFREFDDRELRALCAPAFEDVRVLGLAGSDRYLRLVGAELRRLDRMLALDPLRLRRLVPRRARMWLYDELLRRARRTGTVDPVAAAISEADFRVVEDGVHDALDLIAVCRRSSE
jgi:SAM-dependent methyltransferase